METWQKGRIAVVKIELRAMELDAVISRPLRDDARYDLIVDWCGKLYRVQVKYAGGSRTDNSNVAIVTLTKGSRGERRYTRSEIDALLVYVAPTDTICWFDADVFHGKSQLHIRYAPSKNGQSKGCILQSDYVW